MYPDLLEAITHVQYRYYKHWHPNILSANTPSIHDAAALIETLDKELLNLRYQQPATAIRHSPTLQLLNQILLQKQECIIDAWPPCPPIGTDGHTWYVHDRLLYNGFNYILSSLVIQLHTKLDLATCPSLCCLTDDNGWLSEVAIDYADASNNNFQWLFRFQIFTQTIPYHVERKKLENAVAGLLPQVSEHDTGYALYRSIFRITPQTRQEEKLMVVAMKSIHHILVPHPTNKACEVIRELIYHLVNSTDIYVHWIMEQLDICLEHWKRNQNTIEHHIEYNFWCNQQQCAPNNIYLNYLILQLAAINEHGLSDVNLKKPALTWTLSVKEFIQHFHPMIAKGTITHNGNNDMVPIMTSLHRLFEIPKARGLGSVSRQSLLTYFKNTNADRKDKYGMKMRG